jgi:hypothetical protein
MTTFNYSTRVPRKQPSPAEHHLGYGPGADTGGGPNAKLLCIDTGPANADRGASSVIISSRESV